ncbi:MAG: RtcB family protein, partial [Parcubacteria group bacterium]|nr:RtcB family protein [Parcubacteria group bacterium]
MKKENLIQLNDYLWEIPRSFRPDMLVPARFFANEKLMQNILQDKSLEQLVNVCTLQGIKRYGLAMPDIHEGYASPIGGVAAIDINEGIISPGMQGYDINCGMKILYSECSEKDIEDKIPQLAEEIYRAVPSGLGKGRGVKMDMKELDQILEKGALRLVELGYGGKEDLDNCEAGGCLENADATAVSLLAKQRGRDQVGTLGSGNHFLEIQKVTTIYNEQIAKIFGLFKEQIVIMIHTGSRGLGHQVATDYIKEFMMLMDKYHIKIPDREFACVPFKSLEGQRGFQASQAAANYAWANRQM